MATWKHILYFCLDCWHTFYKSQESGKGNDLVVEGQLKKGDPIRECASMAISCNPPERSHSRGMIALSKDGDHPASYQQSGELKTAQKSASFQINIAMMQWKHCGRYIFTFTLYIKPGSDEKPRNEQTHPGPTSASSDSHGVTRSDVVWESSALCGPTNSTISKQNIAMEAKRRSLWRGWSVSGTGLPRSHATRVRVPEYERNKH